MPILNVKISISPSTDMAGKIANALTDLTVDILKKKRELTAVVIEHVSPSEWYIAGETLAAQAVQSFYLDIKITEGTNTKDEKSAYVSQVFSVIEKIAGTLAPASYIAIHDVRADAWGYQGQTQEFRYVKGKAL